MAVVGVVFAILLRGVDLGSLLPWVNVVLHYIMPVAVVVEWMIQSSPARTGAQRWLIGQTVPLLYLAYVLIRGAIVGWYPYPFLDPELGGYGRADAAGAVAQHPPWRRCRRCVRSGARASATA